MTHDDVVAAAVRWLEGTCKCYAVAGDGMAVDPGGQIPDAIGWRGLGWSIMVEAKTTLTDFYADAKKPSRRHKFGRIGQERWYLLPRGIVDPKRHRVLDGWGLAEIRGGRVFRVITPEKSIFRKTCYEIDEAIQAREHGVLLSLVRYYQAPHWRVRNRHDPIERAKAGRAGSSTAAPGS